MSRGEEASPSVQDEKSRRSGRCIDVDNISSRLVSFFIFVCVCEWDWALSLPSGFLISYNVDTPTIPSMGYYFVSACECVGKRAKCASFLIFFSSSFFFPSGGCVSGLRRFNIGICYVATPLWVPLRSGSSPFSSLICLISSLHYPFVAISVSVHLLSVKLRMSLSLLHMWSGN